MSRFKQALVPIALLLAVVGIGVGVYAIATRPSTASLQTQVSDLKKELASDNTKMSTQITTVKAQTAQAATAGNVSDLQTSVSGISHTVTGMQKTLGQYGICIPQIQQELNSINVQTANTGGYLTDAYIQDPTIVSSNCTRTLNGSQSTGG